MSGTIDVNEPALTLDCAGQRCPLPIIVLARRLPEVAVGEVIALLADDPAARSDVPAWCAMRQQAYLGEVSPGRFLIRRTSDYAGSATALSSAASAP